jgi:hypothetical protein
VKNIQHPTSNIQHPIVVSMVRLFLVTAILSLCGCKSTICMESKKDLHRFDGGSQPVYVTNPEMHREYEILKASAIYRLSNEPEGARKLTLRPIQHLGRCGNPLMLSFVTLGIVPGFLPGAQVFEYDLETDGQVERYAHHLPIYERFSSWEWFVFRRGETTLAKALAWSSRRERHDNIEILR